ncbi:hypothetical protein SLE2022_217400 [Rubroshorea leprosula]
MSRCFPYPPPGYVRRGVHSAALIESIKFQKEGEKAKTEQGKEKKREKGRRKEKKLKAEKTLVTAEKLKKPEDEKIRVETEQLEKSDLTEEHGHPCYLSDGSQSSSKRKREAPSNECQRPVIRRIRFTFKNSQQSEASTSKELAPSRSSLAQQTDLAKPINNVRELGPLPGQDLPHPQDAGRKSNGTGTSSITLFDGKLQRAALRYKDLIEDWVPPLPQQELDDDGQEWLFGTKAQERPATRYETVHDFSCQGSISLWPHANYLPEAQIYALPFTVPF